MDSSVVVIVKPSNLRAVPGFAERKPAPAQADVGDVDASPTDGAASRPRRSSQEAWVLALQSFEKCAGGEEKDSAFVLLRRLASQEAHHLASIPRKYQQFRRYLARNAKRLELTNNNSAASSALKVYTLLQQRQRKFLNLPKETAPEESALGQLSLLLLPLDKKKKNEAQNSNLHVVHRLDCETSGIMVFARTSQAAQSLCRAWRERQVTKVYHALVHDWPPLLLASSTAASAPSTATTTTTSGRIDLALRPSTNERIIWQVDEHHGKPSTTLWRVLLNNDNDFSCSFSPMIRLELVPVTGRTHQLRIHCATVGGGIVGDSLYGRSAAVSSVSPSPPSFSSSFESSSKQKTTTTKITLKLHAYKLCFPHPQHGRQMDFVVDPDW